MFSGIIQTQGVVKRILPSKKQGGVYLEIEAPSFFQGTKVGDSISIDGVCLTAVMTDASHVTLEAMPETLRLTTLSSFAEGFSCNLEKALHYGEPIGGHLMLGHVDGRGKVSALKSDGDYTRMYFEIPKSFHGFLAYKGTIAINGVSLTIAEVTPEGCVVALISHTLSVTNLARLKIGDAVNFEVDMMARYIESILKNYHLPSKI